MRYLRHRLRSSRLRGVLVTYRLIRRFIVGATKHPMALSIPAACGGSHRCRARWSAFRDVLPALRINRCGRRLEALPAAVSYTFSSQALRIGSSQVAMALVSPECLAMCR
jgi:hypothetical protein